MTELIRGVLGSSAILLEQNGITAEFAETEPAYVWADEFKIEEVMTNYLSNAIHHADFEKKISVFYTRKEDCLRIGVFNTGTPIPEEGVSESLDQILQSGQGKDQRIRRKQGSDFPS